MNMVKIFFKTREYLYIQDINLTNFFNVIIMFKMKIICRELIFMKACICVLKVKTISVISYTSKIHNFNLQCLPA